MIEKTNLKFYRWSNIEASIRTERPVEYNIDDFFNEIRQDLPKTTESFAYVINRTVNGKTAADFLCPSMVFIDVDFHFDSEADKLNELKRFYEDTETTSLQEFVDKMSKDKYCISAGLSKSGVGIRMFFNVLTDFYNDSIKYDLDYSVDMNKQIHKSNWNYVMRYLSLYYNFDLDAKYAGGEIKGKYKGDTSANKLSQVTFRYRKEGSFYNPNFESMYNKECFVKETKKFTLTSDIEKYEVPFLDELYKENEQQFKSILEHYDGAYTYALRNQTEDIQMWFYTKLQEHYSADGGLRKRGSLNSFDDFKKEFNKTGGDDLPLKAFFFKRGIYYNEPYEFKEDETREIEEDDLLLISNDIYDKLPQILKDLTDGFENEQKDVVLLSSIACLGYYFNDIVFDYYYQDVYNNILVFIIGDSGIGKGIMTKAEKLLYHINKYHRDVYNAEITAYNMLSKKDRETKPEPIERVIIVGGDATRQGVFKYTNNNDGKLVILDSEADSIMNQKGDYDYTGLIRKSLQNESFSKTISSGSQIYVEKPKLNICISGTRNQLLNVIGKEGAENGTFNRFLLYNWDAAPTISSPHIRLKNKNVQLEYSKLLFDMYNEHLNLGGIMTFSFSAEQEAIFDRELFAEHDETLRKEDNSTSAIVKRYYLMAKKICVTIACLRLVDQYKLNSENIFDGGSKIDFTNVVISDDDFNVVMNIIKTLIKHSIMLFRKFTPKEEVLPSKGWKEMLFDELPETFTRTLVMNLGVNKYKKVERTIDRFIKDKRNENVFKYDENLKSYKKILEK